MSKKIIKVLITTLLFCYCVAPLCGANINNVENETNNLNQTVEAQTIKSLELTTNNNSKQYKWKTGYVKSVTNIKKKTKESSKTIMAIPFNAKIKYAKYNKKWAIVKYKGNKGYIPLKQIKKKAIKSTTYNTPDSKLMSYMSYKAITNTSSRQYKLQKIAYTGNYGIRQVNERYCIAVGSYYTTKIGTYIDLILKNGTVIPCILADCKDDQHTDDNNILTFDGSLAEFVVDTNNLVYNARYTGDVHNACNKWKSDIVKIKIYKKVENF